MCGTDPDTPESRGVLLGQDGLLEAVKEPKAPRQLLTQLQPGSPEVRRANLRGLSQTPGSPHRELYHLFRVDLPLCASVSPSVE